MMMLLAACYVDSPLGLAAYEDAPDACDACEVDAACVGYETDGSPRCCNGGDATMYESDGWAWTDCSWSCITYGEERQYVVITLVSRDGGAWTTDGVYTSECW